MKDKTANIVFGGYVNAYELIRELSFFKVSNIFLIDNKKNIAYYSNKLSKKIIYKTEADIEKILSEFGNEFQSLNLYPTSDNYLEILNRIKLPENSYLPFNSENILDCLKKETQYKTAERIGVPIPKTFFIKDHSQIEDIFNLPLPFIIKPSVRKDNVLGFRNLIIQSNKDLKKYLPYINNALENEIELICSEIVAGKESEIFSYSAFVNNKGETVGEWTGRKLAQHPNEYGVFSSATYVDKPILKEYGQKLIKELNLKGYIQPEFKWDEKASKFKLMEINLRPMMWHRVGFLSGHPLIYLQYLDANKSKNQSKKHVKNKNFIYSYLNYEILNLLSRKNYFTIFKNNTMSISHKHFFATLSFSDPLPFLFDQLKLMGKIFKLILNKGEITKKNRI